MSGYSSGGTAVKIMNKTELRAMLADEKSRVIFDARMNYITDKSLSSFYNIIKSNSEKYTFREVDEFIAETGLKKIYIWGNDDFSTYSYQVLVDAGYSVEGLVCNNKNIQHISNIQYLLEDVKKQLLDSILIIFQRDLPKVPAGILEKSNPLILYSHVVGRTGMQYFDFFLPAENECFLDGGSLDGTTAKQFVNWCNGAYGEVLAFEANPLMAQVCDENLKQYIDHKKLSFYECALWNKRAYVAFNNLGSKWDAHIGKDGNVIVKADSVDNILKKKRITFIKLDIEGSELQALYGARESICRNRPRMAISVYHNDRDLEDIMCYLIELNLNYKFALRHYHSDAIETILYVY